MRKKYGANLTIKNRTNLQCLGILQYFFNLLQLVLRVRCAQVSRKYLLKKHKKKTTMFVIVTPNFKIYNLTVFTVKYQAYYDICCKIRLA